MTTDEWDEEVRISRQKKADLLSFGPYARAVLVAGKYGLFAVDPEDRYVSRALLDYGFYSEPEYLLAKSFINRTSDVLIVGAHIGAHAVPLSKDCRELIAIEANPRSCELLRINFRLNGCTNVTVVNLAANDSRTKLRFLLNTSNSAGSKRRPVVTQRAYTYDNPAEVEVEAVPLDDLFFANKSFDFILMDIEGSEVFALRGMQRILSNAKALSVEFLPHHLAFVAGVDADQFSEAIVPHFEWLFVPRDHRVVPKMEIVNELRRMYAAGEGHEGIYFLKRSDHFLPSAELT